MLYTQNCLRLRICFRFPNYFEECSTLKRLLNHRQGAYVLIDICKIWVFRDNLQRLRHPGEQFESRPERFVTFHQAAQRHRQDLGLQFASDVEYATASVSLFTIPLREPPDLFLLRGAFKSLKQLGSHRCTSRLMPIESERVYGSAIATRIRRGPT